MRGVYDCDYREEQLSWKTTKTTCPMITANFVLIEARVREQAMVVNTAIGKDGEVNLC